VCVCVCVCVLLVRGAAYDTPAALLEDPHGIFTALVNRVRSRRARAHRGPVGVGLTSGGAHAQTGPQAAAHLCAIARASAAGKRVTVEELLATATEEAASESEAAGASGAAAVELREYAAAAAVRGSR
jgi:hypothetical protein